MQHNKVIIEETKASEVIDGNPLTLLMLEHFNIPLGIKEKTVGQLAAENQIDIDIFLSIINLYSGHIPEPKMISSIEDVTSILNFLKNSHQHYLIEQFPLLTMYLSDISKHNTHAEIELLTRFFDDYLDEVAEHLKYEDEIVFPYITNLTHRSSVNLTPSQSKFSISDYRSHHNDIEEKLVDLKNLLIRYLPSQNDAQSRRKLLFALNDLEADLHIHSLIEDVILIPIVERLETSIGTER
ncbi:MAG TPA: hypothetical protein VK212_10215 [Lentimicrobium sp.]|nr:hypothetical protein [Lentimicrobium sp.]